jgi:hypothetical protein
VAQEGTAKPKKMHDEVSGFAVPVLIIELLFQKVKRESEVGFSNMSDMEERGD